MARVSLNAIIGDNGIITNTMNAKEISEKNNIIELIMSKLISYNIGTITDNVKANVKEAMNKLLEENLVDSVFGDTGANTVEGEQSEEGKGGFAGIHCWTNGEKSSVLNISGEGTLYCYGGKGGNITIDNISNVTALNGRFRQDKNDNRETTVLNQCVIYSQLGFSLDEINKDQEIYHTDLDCYQTYKNGDLEVAKVSDTLEYANNPEGMIIFLNNENPNYRTIDYDTYTKYGNLGIGSGAGLHEYSNGSLTISN